MRRVLAVMMLCSLFRLAWAQAGAPRAEMPLHLTEADIMVAGGRGYSDPPYEIDVDQLRGQWRRVALPHALIRQLTPLASQDSSTGPATVVIWYRLQVPAFPASATPGYLYIPRWKTDGQIAVYGDKRLLYQSHQNTYWNGWNIPLWIALADTSNVPPPRTIFLRIERPSTSGGGISTVWLGSDALNWRYRARYLVQVQLPYTSSAAFLAVGVFSFFVWLRLRSETIYLLFFAISVASFLRTLHYHVGESRLPVSDEWFTWLTINAIFWMVLVTHFFLNHLHRHPVPWLDRTVCTVTACVAVITLPTFATILDAYTLAPLAYIVLMFVGTAVGAVGGYQCWRSHSNDGLLLSIWGIVGLLLGVYDWLLQNNYVDIENIYLGPYNNIGAFLIFMYIIYRRFLEANDSVRLVNAGLQQRLQEREDELQESHRRLREIALVQTLHDERQRLTQDMHDGMGSSLLTALLAVERGHTDPAMVADILKNCIDDLKLTIDSMEPVQADLLLLLATLRFRLGPRLESAGINLRWEVQNVPVIEWIDPRNALHILRILQEGFANIVKHAEATEVRVTTCVEADAVLVVISDNGVGFSLEAGLGKEGKGLRNQLRRAASIGAGIMLESDAAGTRLTLRLPVERKLDPMASKRQ
ncbi:sensor histidine kinase [Pseudoduganella sp. SL102]|uniref:sensor histidine kinase n=1 Tax=Pseudoduganella sp. SL102 TaxID=2995154 RepID=UPI00248CAE13|nr:sensor histidine kinase [Pseudoduganella sp. SL102]WBS00416.1 sensor histidine kinase [Pseudoduganella sp. SL102]